MAVARSFPAVARDLEGTADSAGGQNDRLRAKNFETAALPIITESSDHPLAILEQTQNGVLHENLDPLVHSVILEGADHFQPRAISDMGEARIFVSAEIALQDPAVFGAIEDRAPGFELADACRRFLG